MEEIKHYNIVFTCVNYNGLASFLFFCEFSFIFSFQGSWGMSGQTFIFTVAFNFMVLAFLLGTNKINA